MSVPEDNLETVTVTANRVRTPSPQASHPSSFQVHQLRASLTLPQDVFPGTNNNTLVIDSLRMLARIEQSGNYANSCDLSIYGMRQVDMNAVTTVFVNQNGIPYDPDAQAILRLEAVSPTLPNLQPKLLFTGQFYEAQPDYRALPDVCLHAQALTGYASQLTAPPPKSFKGSVDAVQLASQIAKEMGYALVPNATMSARLSSPYLSGSLMDQFQSVIEAAGFDFYYGADATIYLCAKNKGRLDKDPVPVNPQSGLVGYPTLQRYGLEVTVLFNPGIELGAPILIQNSQVPGCDGLWFPFSITHELETIKPNGKWFSRLQCMPFQGST